MGIFINSLVICIIGEYIHLFVDKDLYVNYYKDNEFGDGVNVNNLQAISSLILSERKKHKWSQQQLADFSGLNRTTIGSIERGDYSDVGIRKIEKLLCLFNKSLIVKDMGLPTLDQLKGQNNNG